MKVGSKALIAGTAVAALLASTHLLAAAELRLSGAAAVAGGVINPNKGAIERETGLTLDIVVNGDGNGLRDLYAGKVDVMMVAAPLEATEAELNRSAPGSVSADGIEVAPIGTTTIHFIVHPSNPVKTLTEAQVKDIFTGKVANWRDVGGADQPILVVAEVPGFGTRTNLVAGALGGADIVDRARVMQALIQVAQFVAQVPNAIGYGNAASITPAVAVVSGAEVKQGLGLATRGAPSADVKKLIAAVARFGAQVK